MVLVSLVAVPSSSAACQSDRPVDDPGAAITLAEVLEQLPGVRVERTTAVSGALSIRLFGQAGQYTRVLTDGLPLIGPQFGGLAVAQAFALDVERADVEGGTATAPYGAIHLTSRKPSDRRELVVRQTSLGGTDVLGWYSRRVNTWWGLTAGLGGERQPARDVDGDGWLDVPEVQRLALRPRVFWTAPGGSASVMATASVTVESGASGTADGAVLANGEPFETGTHTDRVDGGLVARFPIAGRDTVALRGSAVAQRTHERFGPPGAFSPQYGRHHLLYAGAAITLPRGRTTWLIDGGVEQDAHQAPDLQGFNYSYTTPYVLVQVTAAPAGWITLTASGRCDWHHRYGTQCGPRAGALLVPGPGWGLRVSGGQGFFAPTPFIDEAEGVALARLVPFATRTIAICHPVLCGTDTGQVQTTAPLSLRAERVAFGSVSASHRSGSLELTAAIFASAIAHRLLLWEFNIFEDRAQYLNAPEPQHTVGASVGATAHAGPLTLGFEYLYVHSTLPRGGGDGQRMEAPLTPSQSGSARVAWRSNAKLPELGLVVRYTGPQTMLDNPYRARTPGYATVDLVVAYRRGRTELFLNGENVGDVRQTRYDPLLVAAPDERGRRTTDLWAPLEGRLLSAGVRVGM